jgi:hypothetical protein
VSTNLVIKIIPPETSFEYESNVVNCLVNRYGGSTYHCIYSKYFVSPWTCISKVGFEVFERGNLDEFSLHQVIDITNTQLTRGQKGEIHSIYYLKPLNMFLSTIGWEAIVPQKVDV